MEITGKTRLAAIFLSVLLVIALAPVLPAEALMPASSDFVTGNITLTVFTEQTNVNVGDEIIFTVQLGDASATDLSAFAFMISLPDGLRYKSNSGAIAPGFQSATGMFLVVFDEEPFLMASGFGDGRYNGRALDIVVFTATATAAGTMSVTLTDVELLDFYVRTIPSTVVSATVTVNANNQGGSQADNQAGNQAGGQTSPNLSTGQNNEPDLSEPSNGVSSEQGGQFTGPYGQLSPFSDVSPADWFFSDVVWAYTAGLMGGTGQREFSPNLPMTRAMLATVLHRIAGTPAASADLSAFVDVPPDAWYADAVAWAVEAGIVMGISETRFAPDINISREQIATMVFRYASHTGADVSAHTDLGRFADEGIISDFAKDAISWATAINMLTGRPGGLLDPKAAATRAEVAAILQRYSEGQAEISSS